VIVRSAHQRVDDPGFFQADHALSEPIQSVDGRLRSLFIHFHAACLKLRQASEVPRGADPFEAIDQDVGIFPQADHDRSELAIPLQGLADLPFPPRVVQAIALQSFIQTLEWYVTHFVRRPMLRPLCHVVSSLFSGSGSWNPSAWDPFVSMRIGRVMKVTNMCHTIRGSVIRPPEHPAPWVRANPGFVASDVRAAAHAVRPDGRRNYRTVGAENGVCERSAHSTPAADSRKCRR